MSLLCIYLRAAEGPLEHFANELSSHKSRERIHLFQSYSQFSIRLIEGYNCSYIFRETSRVRFAICNGHLCPLSVLQKYDLSVYISPPKKVAPWGTADAERPLQRTRPVSCATRFE